MKLFKRSVTALALTGAMFSTAPVHADETGLGVYVCIKYTYVLVAGNWVPTVKSVAVTTTPVGCDTAVGA